VAHLHSACSALAVSLVVTQADAAAVHHLVRYRRSHAARATQLR
jgi:hypothetical protein